MRRPVTAAPARGWFSMSESSPNCAPGPSVTTGFTCLPPDAGEASAPPPPPEGVLDEEEEEQAEGEAPMGGISPM